MWGVGGQDQNVARGGGEGGGGRRWVFLTLLGEGSVEAMRATDGWAAAAAAAAVAAAAAGQVAKISIVPRGGAGGLTFFAPNEDRVDSGLYTRQFLEGQAR